MKQRSLAISLLAAVAALMAFAGSASATTLTSPSGTAFTGVIEAEASFTTIHGPVDITCNRSSMAGWSQSHGSGVTAGGYLFSLTFSECGNNHVTVNSAGSLEIHATSGGNGTVTSTGAEISVQVTSLGITCVYRTGFTDIGTLTGGSWPKLDLDSELIPRTGGSLFCGSWGEWTGSYTVWSPSTLTVD